MAGIPARARPTSSFLMGPANGRVCCCGETASSADGCIAATVDMSKDIGTIGCGVRASGATGGRYVAMVVVVQAGGVL